MRKSTDTSEQALGLYSKYDYRIHYYDFSISYSFIQYVKNKKRENGIIKMRSGILKI